MGGLGNQLFQISTTLATAWDNGYQPIFPRLSVSPSFQAPRPVYWSSLFTQIPTSDATAFSHFSPYHEPNEDFSFIALKSCCVKLIGYWQSPKYFDHYRAKILGIFQPTESLASYIDTRFYELTKGHVGPVVNMHLRRGDYMQIDDFMCLWKDEYKHFYIQAVSYFPANALFMVFSDEPEYAHKFFSENFPDRSAIFPKDTDYVELFLMARCDHAIIANSTFSWWGAYLNTNPEKVVIAPKEWTISHGQARYKPDYLPSDWKTISVINK